MDTMTTTETECAFCGKGLSRRGRGSHEKNCGQNPANREGASDDGALRRKIGRQADAKIAEAAERLSHALFMLCDADPAKEPEWQARAAESVGAAHALLQERAHLLELLAPEVKHGRSR